MIATAASMIVLTVLGQSAPRVSLHELVAHPDRYRDRAVEVRAAFWVTGEESAHLCSDRLDPDDQTGCEAVMPDRAPGVSQELWDRLVAAGRLAATGDHRVYLTLRGRFEAAESPRWGAYGGYSRRLLIEELLRVETSRRTANAHAQGEVRLVVGAPVHEPYGWVYVGTLVNDSHAPVALKAEQQPGGFQGNGTFFGCSLEQWDSRTMVWKEVRRMPRSKPNGVPFPLTAVQVAAGARKDACPLILPQFAGKPGAKVRIRLWSSFDYDADPAAETWVSAPFQIRKP
jgi:hypothetical protein